MSSIQFTNEYLPSDTRQVLPEEIRENEFKNFNFAIIYNLPKIFERQGELKIQINEKIENFKWESGFINGIRNRLEETIKKLNCSGCEITSFQSSLYWRMVIGLGSSHPQETSMTLHHIYGIPYIPGSAVKGVTRHWTILKLYEIISLTDLDQINCLEKILETADLENKDENKRDDKLSKEEFKKKFTAKNSKGKNVEPDDKLYDFLKQAQDKIEKFQNIFGTQNNKGQVIFFDAYPVDKINLKIDIMNPHYPKYYEGKEPPADWQTPVPIKFLTVENTKFQFFLASKEIELLKEAEKSLKEALNEYGIGSKTSLGYGIFTEA